MYHELLADFLPFDGLLRLKSIVLLIVGSSTMEILFSVCNSRAQSTKCRMAILFDIEALSNMKDSFLMAFYAGLEQSDRLSRFPSVVQVVQARSSIAT